MARYVYPFFVLNPAHLFPILSSNRYSLKKSHCDYQITRSYCRVGRSATIAANSICPRTSSSRAIPRATKSDTVVACDWQYSPTARATGNGSLVPTTRSCTPILCPTPNTHMFALHYRGFSAHLYPQIVRARRRGSRREQGRPGREAAWRRASAMEGSGARSRAQGHNYSLRGAPKSTHAPRAAMEARQKFGGADRIWGMPGRGGSGGRGAAGAQRPSQARGQAPRPTIKPPLTQRLQRKGALDIGNDNIVL